MSDFLLASSDERNANVMLVNANASRNQCRRPTKRLDCDRAPYVLFHLVRRQRYQRCPCRVVAEYNEDKENARRRELR